MQKALGGRLTSPSTAPRPYAWKVTRSRAPTAFPASSERVGSNTWTSHAVLLTMSVSNFVSPLDLYGNGGLKACGMQSRMATQKYIQATACMTRINLASSFMSSGVGQSLLPRQNMPITPTIALSDPCPYTTAKLTGKLCRKLWVPTRRSTQGTLAAAAAFARHTATSHCRPLPEQCQPSLSSGSCRRAESSPILPPKRSASVSTCMNKASGLGNCPVPSRLLGQLNA